MLLTMFLLTHPTSPHLFSLSFYSSSNIQSLAYQTKHILDACEEAGHEPIHTIFITGGLVANPLYLQAHADITGCVVEIAAEPEVKGFAL
jgi:ribulose kinase